MTRRRTAEYSSTLVYMDEPLVITLTAQKTLLVGVAVPSEDKNKAPFLATTVNKKDWESYLDGNVDLRYLFTYPSQRIDYYFDLGEMADNKIKLSTVEGDVPEDHLPLPRFFAASHTEEIERENVADNVEKLIVDGEWDMPDFGSFYNRYSDVCYFLFSTDQYANPNTPIKQKRQILESFLSRPFAGGFSYVHLFDDLAGHTARSHRLAVDQIQYASPGYVAIHGLDEVFAEVKVLVRKFLADREEIKAAYSEFHAYLSKNHLLTMTGENFRQLEGQAGLSDYIHGRTMALAKLMQVPHIETIEGLVQNNALVFAKVILVFYRRLDETSKFFAQGRVSFSDTPSDAQ